MRIKLWHAVALITCAVWVVYYPALQAPLCSVDDLRMVNDLLSRPKVGWADVWFPHSVTYYRPLVGGSFILDLLLWNLETPFLHFENILLHWINALLVFILTRIVARRLELDEIIIPCVAALAFALHPVNSEAVIWVAGRADLMAGTFVLLSMICTLRYLLSAEWPWLVALCVAFTAGCLAKETVLFVVPGVCLVSLLLHKSGTASDLRWRLAFPAMVCLASVCGYFLLRGYALHDRDLGLRHVKKAATGSFDAPSVLTDQALSGMYRVGQAAETAFSAAGFYARKLVQPFPLNFGIIDVSAGYFWLGCLLLIFALYLLWQLSWPGCFLLTAMSLGSVALLVALGDISWTPVAERYMYTPVAMAAVGVTLSGAGALQKTQSRYWSIAVPWGLSMLLMAGATGVLKRSFVWQDNLTLFSDTVSKSPGFDLARNELAKALWQRGHKKEALEIIKSLEVRDSQEASLNKVLVFIDEGRLDEARRFLMDKLQSTETNAYRTATLKWLDKILEMLRDQSDDPELILIYEKERVVYLRQLFNNTGDPFYRYRIGHSQLMSGDLVEAQKSFAEAYSLLADDSPYKVPAGKLAEKLPNQ